MNKKRLVNVLAGVVFFFLGARAHAAQSAQVIVPSASVYLYPQSSSNVIAHLNRGQSVTISNLPTEGFYKLRLPNGDVGWVSGNDILAGASGGGGGGGARPAPSRTRKRVRDDGEDAPSPSSSSNVDSFRLLVSYGASSLSFNGLKQGYPDSSSNLNPSKTWSIEAQFKMNPHLFWAARIQTFKADSGVITLSNSDLSQETTVTEIPIEVGLMWSPVSTHRFRWGIGPYLGAVVSSKAHITRWTASTSQQNDVEYGTAQLCADIATQFSIGIGDLLGIVIEAAYRYDKTGTTPDTTRIAPVSGFQIDYSGVVGRIGLEIRL